MFPVRLPFFRSVAVSSWLAAAAFAVSLFASMPIAYADDYSECMDNCTAGGGSSEGCDDVCEDRS